MEPDGKVSEWNEATLKVIRLHELQGTINLLKMDPLGRTDGKFNYVWLANNADALYGEGYIKYTDKERTEVDKLRDMMYNSLKYFPPHKKNINDSMGSSSITFVIDNDNYEMLLNIIEHFLRIIKKCNDDHGLTTKNRETGGLF